MSGENSIRMQFGMKHVLLMIVTMALIVLPVVYFRDYGIVVSIWLTFIAVALWCSSYRVAVAILGFGVLFWMLPETGNAREAARRSGCINNMRNIALAIANYESVHGHFPPAYLSDENGVPMHSWRVLILPYLDEQSLYEKYDFNEPWDGPNNRNLAGQMPIVYRCPSDRSAATEETSYLAILGDHTMWPYAESRRRDEIKDPIGQTILLVENDDARTNWMKPADVEYDDVFDNSIGKSVACISSEHSGGVAIVTKVDVRARALEERIDRDFLKAALTVDGGEDLSEMGF